MTAIEQRTDLGVLEHLLRVQALARVEAEERAHPRGVLKDEKAFSVDNKRPHDGTHLFTVRLWTESLGDNHVEWRGQARHILSGRVHTFREWPALIAFLQASALSPPGCDDSRDQPQEPR